MVCRQPSPTMHVRVTGYAHTLQVVNFNRVFAALGTFLREHPEVTAFALDVDKDLCARFAAHSPGARDGGK